MTDNTEGETPYNKQYIPVPIKISTNFTGCLLGIFIVLKVMHVIDWSWWWVLSPFWIPMVGFLLTVGILYVVKEIFGW